MIDLDEVARVLSEGKPADVISVTWRWLERASLELHMARSVMKRPLLDVVSPQPPNQKGS